MRNTNRTDSLCSVHTLPPMESVKFVHLGALECRVSWTFRGKHRGGDRRWIRFLSPVRCLRPRVRGSARPCLRSGPLRPPRLPTLPAIYLSSHRPEKSKPFGEEDFPRGRSHSIFSFQRRGGLEPRLCNLCSCITPYPFDNRSPRSSRCIASSNLHPCLSGLASIVSVYVHPASCCLAQHHHPPTPLDTEVSGRRTHRKRNSFSFATWRWYGVLLLLLIYGGVLD